VKEALTYEIQRQMEVLNTQGRVIQEPRLWDEARGTTESMRSKEEAHDYRYFPEPDLVPVRVPEDFIAKVRAGLPELPQELKKRFMERYALSDYDAAVLVGERPLAEYFEKAVAAAGASAAKPVCNWMTTELLGHLNAAGRSIQESPVSPEHLAQLVGLVQKGTISGKTAKDVFTEMFEKGTPPAQIVQAKGLLQVGDEATLARWCEEAIAEMPKAVAEYKGGKERAIGSLVGLVMKKSQGKANPQLVNQILQKQLAS